MILVIPTISMSFNSAMMIFLSGSVMYDFSNFLNVSTLESFLGLGLPSSYNNPRSTGMSLLEDSLIIISFTDMVSRHHLKIKSVNGERIKRMERICRQAIDAKFRHK